MKPANDIKRIFHKAAVSTYPSMDQMVLEKVLTAHETASLSDSTASRSNVRSTIMRSPITRLAIAAAVVAAVLIGMHQFGGSAPAFADIVQPLLSARTATFKMTFDIEGSPLETFDCMCMEPGRIREVRPGGVIRILNHHHYQTMMLYPPGKKAMVLKMTDLPEDRQGQANPFDEIREWVRQAQETEDESVEFIGKQDIGGVRAFGYRIRVGEISKMTNRTIWADAETLLPIRIEYSIGNGSPMGVKGTITYSDFVFNVELDESLFVVPEGYEVNTIAFDASETSEDDLIQALRLWPENTDGKFPSELNIKAAGKLFQLVKEKMGLNLEEGEVPDFAQPQFSEFYPIRQKIIRGLGFKSRLPSESDWHYAGRGVRLGDADTAIFWYRPKSSETYRVIYGDLRVEDALPQDVPK